jgi:gamma-glutamyl hercynylcysteine S-oxide synthase
MREMSAVVVRNAAMSVGHSMAVVPACSYQYRRHRLGADAEYASGGWWGLFDPPENRTIGVSAYAIDRYEVTNRQFSEFISATSYRPRDAHNFLRHWNAGRMPAGLEDHPVTWVSLADARAYCAWADLRLPTDVEWQLAAQGLDGRSWPWGNEFDRDLCNGAGAGTTPVATHSRGVSPFGCFDMAGNVWEWTESEGFDGAHRYCYIRSGSWYTPAGASSWYAPGGPLPVHDHYRFLLLDDSFDRCPTVGFRCAKTVDASEADPGRDAREGKGVLAV